MDWKTKLNGQLNEYTKELVAELSRRFGSDTEMIIGMVIFNNEEWINKIKYLKLPGINPQVLADEARIISKTHHFIPSNRHFKPFQVLAVFSKGPIHSYYVS